MKSGPIVSRPACPIINSIVRTILHASSFLLLPSTAGKRGARSFVSRLPFAMTSLFNSFFFFFLKIQAIQARPNFYLCSPLRLTRSSLNFITRPFPVQCVVVHFNVWDQHRLLLNRWQRLLPGWYWIF